MNPRSNLQVVDLGRLAYDRAYEVQSAHVERVLAARETPEQSVGVLLLVEHDPVITISRRAGAADHLLASRELLAEAGIAIEQTDRGGDITYHGPGQLVAYPILDLSLLNLGLHAYMRLLEDVVIGTLARFGVVADRDSSATGVWVGQGPAAEKICAMGVRVRRWVSMHGLALNVNTNLEHFGLIVPCGLHGRGVTSLKKLLGADCPPMSRVKAVLAEELSVQAAAALDRAVIARGAVS